MLARNIASHALDIDYEQLSIIFLLFLLLACLFYYYYYLHAPFFIIITYMTFWRERDFK